MARLARVVVPGLAHHVTSSGAIGREPVFFNDDDYRAYIALIGAAAVMAIRRARTTRVTVTGLR
jgi:putative transposase